MPNAARRPGPLVGPICTVAPAGTATGVLGGIGRPSTVAAIAVPPIATTAGSSNVSVGPAPVNSSKAAAWLMLVVAELLAAQEGLAFQIVRAQPFRAVDTMFALLIVFGFIGLVSDLALRGLRNLSAPWARS